MVALGPMPASVRVLVRRLVAEARPEASTAEGRLDGFLLTGGPGGCSFLDADGEAWDWSAWDESAERVPDGPRKVGLVAIAAERVPGLPEWLPRRPVDAIECDPCRGSGWLPPPLPRVQCPECNGLGWLPSQVRA
jgi:hypothetical protein